MKLVWLLSVPVVALVALFAVRTVPTFAVPACSDACVDQTIGNTYTQNVIYQQVAGMYCNDKTGGDVFVPTGAPVDPGLKCPSTTGGNGLTSTPAGTARATGTASTSSGTATGTPRPATATATATATRSAGS
jgi:hypothetical protein